jgi:hypothetical protein
MKLHITAFANAAAIVTAVLYSLCSLALAVFPDRAYPFFSFLFHVDLQPSVVPMSWGVYIGGLVIWVIASWLTGAGLAGLYNRLVRG